MFMATLYLYSYGVSSREVACSASVSAGSPVFVDFQKEGCQVHVRLTEWAAGPGTVVGLCWDVRYHGKY